MSDLDRDSKISTHSPQKPGFAFNELWSWLTSDPTSGVALLDRSLTVQYCNAKIAQMLFGPDAKPEQIVGQPVKDLYPEPVYEERVQMSNRVAETGKPMLSRTIWQGQQMLTWIYPICSASDGDSAGQVDQFMVIMRFISDEPDLLAASDHEMELYFTEHIDLGELAKLTPRELVVLAMLGQGLSLKEVAEHADRSVKTIEAQRDSVSRKLNLRNRSELIKLVHRIGLTLDDTERTHFSRSDHQSGAGPGANSD